MKRKEETLLTYRGQLTETKMTVRGDCNRDGQKIIIHFNFLLHYTLHSAIISIFNDCFTKVKSRYVLKRQKFATNYQ